MKVVTLTKGVRCTSSARLQFEKKVEAEHAITHMNNGYIDGVKIGVEGELGADATQVDRKKSPEKVVKK